MRKQALLYKVKYGGPLLACGLGFPNTRSGMANKSGVAMVLMSLVLGTGIGAAVGGCGEDRGSVDVEGGTTGTTGTVGTTTTPETDTGTSDDSGGDGY